LEHTEKKKTNQISAKQSNKTATKVNQNTLDINTGWRKEQGFVLK